MVLLNVLNDLRLKNSCTLLLCTVCTPWFLPEEQLTGAGRVLLVFQLNGLKQTLFYTNTIPDKINFSQEKQVNCHMNYKTTGKFTKNIPKNGLTTPKRCKIPGEKNSLKKNTVTFNITFTQATKILQKHCLQVHTFLHIWPEVLTV